MSGSSIEYETHRAVRDVQSRMSSVHNIISRIDASLPRGGAVKYAAGPRPADVVIRSAVSELLRRMTMTSAGPVYDESASDVVARVYRNCPQTLVYLARTATSPATVAGTGWAAELVQDAVADFLIGDQPASALAQLAARTLRV